MSTLPETPPSLKSVKAYLEQGKLRASDPVVSYHCNLYALQEAMAMRAKIPKADMGFIMALMDHVEAQKKTLGDVDAASMQAQVENAAADLFQKADDADRGGNHGLQVAKDFLASANIFEVCKQFMDDQSLPEDMAEKAKYGKWRFVELCKAAKERRAPAPPRGMEEGTEGSSEPPGTSAIEPQAQPHADYLSPPVGPPPSYMDLPPASPAVGMQPTIAYPPQVGDSAQPSFDAPSVPHVPQAYGGYTAPPMMPQHPMPVNPAFKPSLVACAEAQGLCKSAADCLAFQDHVTALASLQQAIALLTQPPPQVPQ
uniref:Vta1/callose synthase N-terminal domain-containing protein n=1 Tax=Haptolina brevifila TaxID=156173 RepID=A0A7S2HKP5_9EUKA|mmetsp:Transcript_55488/g.110214  ORF Transcript_55488/g.110214 Transcript_55488/m.110214 type:complete len:313 (+) Transcript_55488:99-1037(+)